MIVFSKLRAGWHARCGWYLIPSIFVTVFPLYDGVFVSFDWLKFGFAMSWKLKEPK